MPWRPQRFGSRLAGAPKAHARPRPTGAGAVPGGKDVIVTTPEEIARRGDLVGTVLPPAPREGRVVYERA